MDPKDYFDAKNEPKDLTDKEKSEAKKVVLAARVRHYIERKAGLAYSMNIMYGIIWEKKTQGLQSVLKGNEAYPAKSKI